MSLNSLKAVPMNAMPKGWFGPVLRVGVAGASVVLADKKPSGTIRCNSEYQCTWCWDNVPVTIGYPAIAAGADAPPLSSTRASRSEALRAASIPRV